jgi:hypothetical protein
MRLHSLVRAEMLKEVEDEMITKVTAGNSHDVRDVKLEPKR